MPISSLLPARFRGSNGQGPAAPTYLNRHLSPLLQNLTHPACQHPIRTIVFILVLASSSYIGLLEGSLFDAANRGGAGAIDLPSLVDGGRQLRVSRETGWKWQADNQPVDVVEEEADHLALVTLVFPNSLSHNSQQVAPDSESLPLPLNSSAKSLPTTSNPFSPLSQDSSLAYSMPWSEVSAFLEGIHEIPEQKKSHNDVDRAWITKASKSTRVQGSWTNWVGNAWSEFVDLLKHAEMLDIIIMSLGYLSMHLTFVSLFMSMRKLGSNFWLATTTLFSSVFAFLFGLVVTTNLGVPINMVLLSEGLPFLVVTIGFEKPIVLTKAVLSASLQSRKQSSQRSAGSSSDVGPKTIQEAINFAVREKGLEIVRDYAIEIAILIAGAASGVQGGLRQFCFLAAWILVFDGILLFTFYTAILCVKLEINRIKRHVALRRALEEDGVSRRVAENVARNNEWPKLDDSSTPESRDVTVFGRKVGDRSIPKFKFLLFGGFILLNVVNICTIPFRTGNKNAQSPTLSGIQGVVNSPPIDPFKVAENGLDFIHAAAQRNEQFTVVTVLAPVKYELRAVETLSENEAYFEGGVTDPIIDAMGGRVFEGVLKSLEDPVLSKWIIVALTISLALNGYLFNAARWSIKEPKSSIVEDNYQPRVTTPTPPTNATEVPAARTKPTETNGHAIESIPPAIQHSDLQSGEDRSPDDCEKLLKDGKAAYLNDSELTNLAVRGKIPGYALEKTLENTKVMTRLQSLTRAVKIRRNLVSRTPATSEITSQLETSKLPYEGFNYENVHGACCENVIGYLPLPIGVAGPLVIDGQSFFLPMATTEGVLVASTNRGCKAINAGGGAVTVLTGDGMTRGPCIAFNTLSRAGAAKVWLDSAEGQKVMKDAFNSTSRFARLQTMKTALAGTYLYIRFKTTTGDAMGMNMISKGVECALDFMRNEAGFDDMAIISVSGNFCTDKKPAAINWIDGRGKSVVAEAIIPGDVIRKVLKSDVNALVELNTAKNLIGSAMAGSIGGFNAHAANLVAAMYLATGQDPAQVVESSQCITVMKNMNGNLQISVSMPCLEVGTIGGGTVLEPQQAMLDLLGVKGAHPTNPGDNSRKLARIIAASVLAGELSLCSALAAGHLVRAHMAHNRSTVTSRAPTPVQTALASAASKGQLTESIAMTSRR